MRNTPSPIDVVEDILDEVGRACPPELIRSLLRSLGSTGDSSTVHLLAQLGLQLTFVLDTSSVQRVLRVTIRHGNSGVLDAMRAGFVRPLAPHRLDDEIHEHASDIARDCGVRAEDVLGLYTREIRPLIEFGDVSVGEVARLRREMSDPNDADFVALFLAVEAIGILTEDKGFAEAGVRTLTVSDLGRIQLVYRKQFVAIACPLPVAMLGIEAIAGFARGAVSLCSLIKRHPQIAFGTVGLVFALAILFPEPRRSIVGGSASALSRACEKLGGAWNETWPFVLAYVEVCGRRAAVAARVTDDLAVRASG